MLAAWLDDVWDTERVKPADIVFNAWLAGYAPSPEDDDRRDTQFHMLLDRSVHKWSLGRGTRYSPRDVDEIYSDLSKDAAGDEERYRHLFGRRVVEDSQFRNAIDLPAEVRAEIESSLAELHWNINPPSDLMPRNNL